MARFDGEADFSNRGFQLADFTNACFYWPPNFDNVIGASQIDFTGAHFFFVPAGRWLHWTENSRIPVRLRALRKIVEETKNHDLERDLYIEEREAERGVKWRQLSSFDELEKKLIEIDEQEKPVWLEWRLKRRARNARWIRLLAKPAQFGRLIAHLLWIGVIYWAPGIASS
jgi:hypothetical protein